jgi:hypothetical protein
VRWYPRPPAVSLVRVANHFLQPLFARLRECTYAVCQPDPRAFAVLDWRTRQRLNLQSLALFLRSAAAARLLLWWLAWVLAGLILCWEHDMRGSALLWPLWSSYGWLVPCLLRARKRCLRVLLRPLWG